MGTQYTEEGHRFEQEVRSIARQLWADSMVSGAITIEQRERDGLYETEESIHLLEATTSRQKSKAEGDIRKLVSLAQQMQREQKSKAVRCWFITKDEPTPDQQAVAYPHRSLVTVESFSRFRARLIEADLYLQLRDKYPFGSVRDPRTGKFDVDVGYIPLEMLEVGTEKIWSVQLMSQGISGGGHFVLLGDYGAGKSMTLRQIYLDQKKRYSNEQTSKFPVYLNLRDHVGQDDAVEVLERHAKRIGFPKPHHLVRAWRAGYVTLLIDGFDEVPALGIQGLWRRLQQGRFQAMQAVRQFIREQPISAGLVITGRAHFFDSEKERRIALGTSARTKELSLSEFSELQIKEFLRRAGIEGKVPTWLPTRPLLVGYLAARGFLRAIITAEGTHGADVNDPAKGWNMLLDSICAREAEIEPGIDGPTVRVLLERLGSITRRTASGLGPLTAEDTVSAFETVCGYAPDPKAMMLLQRLPGLGVERADEDTRVFIDQDFVSVCRAGDVVRFVASPYDQDLKIFAEAQHCSGPLGTQVAADKLQQQSLSLGKFNAAAKRAADSRANSHLLCDLALIACEAGWDVSVPCFINNVSLPTLELHSGRADLSAVTFRDCYFGIVDIDSDYETSRLPSFSSCWIGTMEGRVARADLPPGKFDDDCLIDAFGESTRTTDAIVDMALPIGTRVALTILKKLYLQSGGGRRESALFRGLDHHGKRLVPAVLRLLRREGLALESQRGTGIIWLPVRGETNRVSKIVASPATTSDPLIKLSAQIS